MLDLSVDEQRALQIVVLRTSVESETYGAAHQLNWKKVGLSRAYFRPSRLAEHSMPTPRATAAFRFLKENNEYYRSFLQQHNAFLDAGGLLTISSYDLFVVMDGIECAMCPHLYPTARFTDSCIRTHILEQADAGPARVVSIARSWAKKILSGVRVYAEHRDLALFMYEEWMAVKFFHAQARAQRLGVTGDVLTRGSQASHKIAVYVGREEKDNPMNLMPTSLLRYDATSNFLRGRVEDPQECIVARKKNSSTSCFLRG